MRDFGKGILALGLLVLAACGPTGIQPGASIPADGETGLVLLKTWAGAENRNLLIQGFDDQRKALIPRKFVGLRHSHGFAMGADGALTQDAPEHVARYHLLPMKPGDYVVASISQRLETRLNVFCFARGTLLFTPRPGEVLSFGAININGPVDQMGSIGTSASSMFDESLPAEEADAVLAAFGDIDALRRDYETRPVAFTDCRP